MPPRRRSGGTSKRSRADKGQMHAKHADSAQDHLRVQRAFAVIGAKNLYLPDIAASPMLYR
jgi:hypothetical protein